MKRTLLLRAGISGVLVTSLLTGCASMDATVALTQQVVTPMATGEAADVLADDLALAMIRAGFSREEVLEYGPALRNALATSGSAQMRNGGQVSALFAVFGDQLYVSSRTRGTFAIALDERP